MLVCEELKHVEMKKDVGGRDYIDIIKCGNPTETQCEECSAAICENCLIPFPGAGGKELCFKCSTSFFENWKASVPLPRDHPEWFIPDTDLSSVESELNNFAQNYSIRFPNKIPRLTRIEVMRVDSLTRGTTNINESGISVTTTSVNDSLGFRINIICYQIHNELRNDAPEDGYIWITQRANNVLVILPPALPLARIFISDFIARCKRVWTGIREIPSDSQDVSIYTKVNVPPHLGDSDLSGRPHALEDEWAWHQVHTYKNPPPEVYKKWTALVIRNHRRGLSEESYKRTWRTIMNKPAWKPKRTAEETIAAINNLE